MYQALPVIRYPLSALAMACGLSLLSGCIDDNEESTVTPSNHYAVLTTVAPDFGSGNVSIVSMEDYSISKSNFSSKSDTTMSTNSEYFYHINRTDGNVSRFHINSPTVVESQHAAQALNESTGNPYKLIVKNETTAYLIRWNESNIWIVNPSAANDETYKTGQIDLSTYTGGDGGAEATDAKLIDNKLYVMMQNLDKNNGYTPGTAYIAIFDTENNNDEIATNSDSTTPMGIQLIVTNPSALAYLSSNKTLYVSGVGAYPADYKGGVEAINITDFSTTLIVDDGDTNNAPYGQIINVAILNGSQGYFVGSASYQKASLYSFDPSTGNVNSVPLISDQDLGDIEIGPLGNLWVGNRSAVGITIIDTVDNSVLQALISTDPLLPNDIEFVSINKTN